MPIPPEDAVANMRVIEAIFGGGEEWEQRLRRAWNVGARAG